MPSGHTSFLASPAPLERAGFALPAILPNIHNAGRYELRVMNTGMGVCDRSPDQILASIMEWPRPSCFDPLGFVFHDLFRLSLIRIGVLSSLGPPAAYPFSMGWHLAFWGLFAFILFPGALKGKTTTS